MTLLPFNRPFSLGSEFEYITHAIQAMHLSGNGTFTRRCHDWLGEQTSARRALLRHSCPAAHRHSNHRATPLAHGHGAQHRTAGGLSVTGH